MDDLPEKGWTGYGSPGHPFRKYPIACKATFKATTPLRSSLRAYVLKCDDNGHELREYAFSRWLESTVYAQSVNRWIADIGANA